MVSDRQLEKPQQCNYEGFCPHETLTSAPEAPGMLSAIILRLMPRVRFILREWILTMSSRA